MTQISNNISLNNPFTRFNFPAAPAGNNDNVQKPHQPVASVKLSDKNHNSLTKTVAISAVAGAVIAVLLFKGPSAKFTKNFNSYLQKLDDKIFDYSQKYSSLGTIQRIGLSINKGLRKILAPLKGINNITSFKDTGFRWLTDKLRLKWLTDWITNTFKKVTIKSSQKAHQKARNLVDEKLLLLRKYIPLIEKENPEAAKQLAQKINLLEKQVLEATSSQARNKRFEKYVNKGTENLGKEVTVDILDIIKHPIKNIKKIGVYRTEAKSEAQRMDFSEVLQTIKHEYSFNIQDKQRLMKESADKITQTLNVNDKASRQLLRDLSKKIQDYGNLSGKDEALQRSKLVETIKNTVNTLKANLQKGNYSQEERVIFDGQINQLEQVLGATEQRGIIEQILQLLNTELKSKNPQEYLKAKNIAKEMKTALNNAFDSELKMFGKFAEYSVGSAPTDVAGIVAPIAIAGYAVSRGKNKDEKVSATLKAAIPITGAVATSFLAAAKMITGIKGLSLAFTAGLILNAIGSKVDEQYKKYCENRLFTQKAIAEFRKNNNLDVNKT